MFSPLFSCDLYHSIIGIVPEQPIYFWKYFSVQHENNRGQCGICGDNYADPRPRKHEHGGEYGRGIVVENYKPGQVNASIVCLLYNRQSYNINDNNFFMIN